MRTNLLNPLGPPIRLASRSPRRAELLRLVGAHFEVTPADVDESPWTDERPEAHVLRLAEAKARAASAARDGSDGPEDDAVYVGADTIVVLDRAILGKPEGPADAARMLALLSGRVHEVWTGLFVFDPRAGRGVGEAVRSIVKFARIAPDQIRRYIEGGEPLDKAGAYAVQGGGAVFVEAIEGSYANVVGLPLSHLKHLLGLLAGAEARPK